MTSTNVFFSGKEQKKFDFGKEPPVCDYFSNVQVEYFYYDFITNGCLDEVEVAWIVFSRHKEIVRI